MEEVKPAKPYVPTLVNRIVVADNAEVVVKLGSSNPANLAKDQIALSMITEAKSHFLNLDFDRSRRPRTFPPAPPFFTFSPTSAMERTLIF